MLNLEYEVNVATDRELVLEFRPKALVASRHSPRSAVTEYQVVYEPVLGKGCKSKIGWVETETLAWRAACIRMGLRIRRV